MIIITVAHYTEAEPLIQALDLKQVRSITAKPVFENESLRLVISRLGTVNAAIATSLALATVSPSVECAAVNFGICGARSSIPVGTLGIIHSIQRNSDSRSFYPDMLLDLKLPQFSLETRDAPWTAEQGPLHATDLIDMEAGGFFEAARAFLSPDRIFVIKVVSDHGESFDAIKARLPDIIRKQTAPLREILRMVESWLKSKSSFTPEQQALISQLRSQLRLTETQSQKLLFLCRARASRDDLERVLTPFMEQGYTHRKQRSTVYSEIVDALSVSLV